MIWRSRQQTERLRYGIRQQKMVAFRKQKTKQNTSGGLTQRSYVYEQLL